MQVTQALMVLRSLRDDAARGDFPVSENQLFAWADEVLQVLYYTSRQYYESFEAGVDELKSSSTRRDTPEKLYRHLRTVVDESITFLERRVQREALAKEQTAPPPPAGVTAPVTPLRLPDIVTLRWLSENVGWRVWLAAVGVLAVVFSAGVAVAHSKFYKRVYLELTAPADW